MKRWLARVVGFVEAPQMGLGICPSMSAARPSSAVVAGAAEFQSAKRFSYVEPRDGSRFAPKAVRAVAGACAANNLVVAIPCPSSWFGTTGALVGVRLGALSGRRCLPRSRGRTKTAEGLQGLHMTEPSARYERSVLSSAHALASFDACTCSDFGFEGRIGVMVRCPHFYS